MLCVLNGMPHTEEKPQKMEGVVLAPGYDQQRRASELWRLTI